MSNATITLDTVRESLKQTRGRDFWRGLEELANSAEFQDFLEREFPRQASEWLPQMNRRTFLSLAGASLALAGLTACSGPAEKIIPYVFMPEDSVPGQSLFFASAMGMGGFGTGLLVQSQLNRPTKIEGNPDHPASLGATDIFAQASILSLYDPDRAKAVTHLGESSTWSAFLLDLRERLSSPRAVDGTGLRILTQSTSSPSFLDQMARLSAVYPNARWHQYEPINRDNVYAGTRLAFGEALEPVYDVAKANVVVSLDANFLQNEPGHIRHARDFAEGRRADAEETRARNRLYAFECEPTITGAAADHRAAVRSGRIETVARQLAHSLGLEVQLDESSDVSGEWIAAIADDLQANRQTGLIIAGAHQPPAVHALAHAMNDALGNSGQTVFFTDPVLAGAVAQNESLQELVEEMRAGSVEALLILEGNPVFSAPVDLEFEQALAQVPFTAHLGLYSNETGAACRWQIPALHYLEAWGDIRAFDGTITVQQPLISPLYEGFSACEVLDALVDEEPRTSHDIVKTYWSQRVDPDAFDTFWEKTLHDGFVADSALPQREAAILPETIALPLTPIEGETEINFRPDPAVWDGRFANNGWLQELPKPLTKLTWENALHVSPLTAERLDLKVGDIVSITYAGRTLEAPVWPVPGHAENAVTVHVGYGRTYAGRVGTQMGFNAFALRRSAAPWFDTGVTLNKVGSGYELASTQLHHSMEGRNPVRVGTVAQLEADPEAIHETEVHAEEISLYPKFEYPNYSWGMAIDLTSCIGCNACMVACQAENNIPIVGKEEVLVGREMHWIRLDRYYEGEPANPATHFQPVMCMHCENAPCEVVCPVAATLHDSEGLNVMVYNRCIGTRYCSNNCPYKVRRFNFLEYTDYESESLMLQRNPNVTVRARGVMEKCTYCVQRISAARISSKLEDREIRDGEVITACQAACPTRAISFGNLNDPESEVVQRKASALNYGLLTHLNTHPRTTYLAKIRNPNPRLEGSE